MAIRKAEPEFQAEGARSRYHGKRMTLETYLALPEEKPYLEYWDGVVLQKAVPKRKHRQIQREVVLRLALYQRQTGGDSGPEGHVWFEGHGYRVPDVAYWAPDKPQGDDDRSLPPTLAVEIRSSGQAMAGLREKCRGMVANGVDMCWLIDPETRTAEVFEGSRHTRLAGEGTLASPLLAGFELPLRELFAVLDH